MTGLDIDNNTTTGGYSQGIGKPIHFINVTSPCIDLVFCSNTSIIRNHLIEQLNNEFSRNLHTTWIMVFLTSKYLYFYLIREKYGIIKMKTQKVFIKNFSMFIEKFKNKTKKGKFKLLLKTLMDVFRNYIFQKTKKRLKANETLIICTIKTIDTCQKLL